MVFVGVDTQCMFNGVSLFISSDYYKPSNLYCSTLYQLTVKMDPLSCSDYVGDIINTTNAFVIDTASNEVKGDAITLNTTTSPQVFPGQLGYGTYLIVFKSKVNSTLVNVKNFEFGFIKILPVLPSLSVVASPTSLFPVNPNEHNVITFSANINYLQSCPPQSNKSVDGSFYWYCRDFFEIPLYFMRDLQSLPYVEQTLDTSSQKRGCFGSGSGLLNTTHNKLTLMTSQLLTNTYLTMDVMTIIENTRIYRTIPFMAVLKNISSDNSKKP